MDKHVLKIFQREVERQCKFAIIAADNLDNSVIVGDMDNIWYSIQALLVAVGNVSKLLWPPSPRIPARADILKQSLGVDDSSPLEPRIFRNHFEHFDERLEQWAMASRRKNFVDSNVGPTGMISGIDPEDYLRNYNPENGVIIFRGDEYHLQPIIDAVRELHEKASNEANRAT